MKIITLKKSKLLLCKKIWLSETLWCYSYIMLSFEQVKDETDLKESLYKYVKIIAVLWNYCQWLVLDSSKILTLLFICCWTGCMKKLSIMWHCVGLGKYCLMKIVWIFKKKKNLLWMLFTTKTFKSNLP